MNEYIIETVVRGDIDWSQVDSIENFHYPWKKGKPTGLKFRAVCDREILYFRFDVKCDKINVKRGGSVLSDIEESERVELFFCRDELLNPYYCLEMTPDKQVMDFEARYHRIFDKTKHWPDDLEIKSERNEGGYFLEGKLQLSTLKRLGLLNKGTIFVGVYRAECLGWDEEGRAKMNWVSWVDPKTAVEDFHIWETFGRWIMDYGQ